MNAVVSVYFAIAGRNVFNLTHFVCLNRFGNDAIYRTDWIGLDLME